MNKTTVLMDLKIAVDFLRGGDGVPATQP